MLLICVLENVLVRVVRGVLDSGCAVTGVSLPTGGCLRVLFSLSFQIWGIKCLGGVAGISGFTGSGMWA